MCAALPLVPDVFKPSLLGIEGKGENENAITITRKGASLVVMLATES
jgi:hypothetical protein